MELPKLPIYKLVHNGTHIPAHTTNSEVAEMFKKADLRFLAVTDHNAIVGLISKEKFLSKIGTQFGWALFARKPVTELMERRPLVVDGNLDVMDAVKQIVERGEDDIYDDVLVCTNNTFSGMICVADLMRAQLERTQQQLEFVEKQRALLANTISAHLLDRHHIDEETMNQKVEAIVDAAHEMVQVEGHHQQKGGSLPSYFSGKLELFSAVDLLQLLVQGGKTGRLVLMAPAKEDKPYHIFLSGGAIVHAIGEGKEGTSALWRALALREGDFNFVYGDSYPVQTIDERPMNLLLEACRRQDEGIDRDASGADKAAVAA